MNTRLDGAIEAVTFDFYRTLVHHRSSDGGRGRALRRYFDAAQLRSKPWEHDVLYEVFEGHARDYSPYDPSDRKRAYRERLTAHLFQRLGLDLGEADPAKRASEIWEIIGPACLGVYADVPEALRSLQKRGYLLAVVSNWHCGLGHFCTELGLAQFFNAVIASAECGMEKPNPRIFELAAERLGVPVNRIIHVGDSPAEDVAGARSAGMRAVLIDRNAPCPFNGVITNPQQLNDVLTRS